MTNTALCARSTTDTILDPSITAAEINQQALRAEMDQVDDAILSLLERRQALTARVGSAKACSESVLRLKPNREATVLQRLSHRAEPPMHKAACAVWREVMSAGLAVQENLEVLVWTGEHASHLLFEARHRFGAHPSYRLAANPQEALLAAEHSAAVAVLALDDLWWTTLANAHPQLWAFEQIRRPRSGEPLALAVGRIAADALAHGPVLRAVRGGDANGDLRPAAPLHVANGWLLRAENESVALDALSRHAGVIGRAPALPWSAPTSLNPLDERRSA